VHQPLDGNGSITARVTALTGRIPDFSGSGGTAGGTQLRSGLVPWAKAGIIIKASTRPGSAYAAMMITGGHGVRMQYDYTGDVPGAAGAVSAASPRWLRLTRSGDVIAGYDSADGAHWTKVAAVTLAGLPSSAQGGLFAASPPYVQTSVGELSVDSGLTQAAGAFDHIGLRGAWPDSAWTGDAIGAPGGPAAGSPGGFTEAAGRLTVSGTGDIAPSVSGASGLGVTIAQTLIGVFAGLIAVAVVGAMFITAEYRRGLIRVTFAAAPRRGRVLAAKAVVIAAVTFAAGLVSAAAVIVVIVLPYLLTVTTPLLPAGPTDWLARVTPAAAFAVQHTLIQYPQVSNVYAPSAGYWPLPPWAGFAVLCAWAAVALGLAAYLLNRRDA